MLTTRRMMWVGSSLRLYTDNRIARSTSQVTRYASGVFACCESACALALQQQRECRLWAFRSIVLCVLAILRLHMINRHKIAQCEREGITAEKAGVFVELGDGSPLYRYILHSIEVSSRRLTIFLDIHSKRMRCLFAVFVNETYG